MAEDIQQDLQFPLSGIDTSREFDSQRIGTTIHALNVRTNEPSEFRARGGSRSGLSKYLPGQVANGSFAIQHLNFVVDPQGDAIFGDDDSEDDPTLDYIDDPSTRNHSGRRTARNLRIPRTRTRKVPRKGSGKPPKFKYPTNDYVIYWDRPTSIHVGTPLSGIQQNAVSLSTGDGVTFQGHGIDVSGSFVYTPSGGTVLKAGNGQKLSVTFTPTDRNTYKQVKTKTVTIDVSAINEQTTYYGIWNGVGPNGYDEGFVEVHRLLTNTDTSTTISDVSLGERLLHSFYGSTGDFLGETVEVFIPENGLTPYQFKGDPGA